MNKVELLINKIFYTLKTTHTNNGFLFKGEDGAMVADAWKEQFLYLLSQGKVIDAQEAIKKIMCFTSKWDKNFPTPVEVYLYLHCDSYPSMEWLLSVAQQIKSNEYYNRFSENRGITVTHRNNNAPDEWWNIAESLAKNLDMNFAQFSPDYAQRAVIDAMVQVCHEKQKPKEESKGLDMNFSQVKKLALSTPEKRNEALKALKAKVGIYEKSNI